MNEPLSLYSVGCLISRGVVLGETMLPRLASPRSDGLVFSSSKAVPFLKGFRIIGIAR